MLAKKEPRKGTESEFFCVVYVAVRKISGDARDYFFRFMCLACPWGVLNTTDYRTSKGGDESTAFERFLPFFSLSFCE